MNKYIKLVEKWLNDKNSVTQEELEQNKEDAAAAAYYATNADAAYAYAAAAYATYADAADAAYWVKEYYRLTGEEK